MPIASTSPISVVVPCYNAEPWLGAALDSVLSQDFPVREIIVVDDGSSDRSVELVRSGYRDVTLITQPNAGVAAARNRGIERASGDWIAFIDADDVWLPGKLAAQWTALQEHAQARMTYAAWHVWESEEARPSDDLMRDLQYGGDEERWAGPSGWIYADLLIDCHVWTSTVVIGRLLLEELGVFDTSLRVGEDYDLWLRASRVTPILRVSRPLALYRMHPRSLTKGPPAANNQAFVISRALERWGYESPDGSRAVKAKVDRAIARSWSDYAGAHMAADSLELARHGALMSVRAYWKQFDGWKLLARSLARSVVAAARRP